MRGERRRPLRVRIPSDDEPPLRPCRALAPRLVRVSNHCNWEQGLYNMMRAFTPSVRRSTFALLAVLAGASCDRADSPMEPTDAPAAAATTDSTTSADTSTAATDSLAPAFATISYTGLAYGAFGLWDGATSFEWGPAPFTGSHDNTFANSIVTRINTARQKKQRLILAMTGGPSSNFKTDGKFDLAKWKNRMNTFKTSTIKNAVAAGVADGTIIGNTIMDEPETKQWGGVMTKPLLDNMATYVKDIFPTLPVGVNHGGPGYKWRTWERYQVVDYTLNQYMWQTTSGNITAWRDAVIDRARTEGVTPAFSLNLLNGGVPDNSGTWDCAGTGGKGTRDRKCRMTADQVSKYGKAVGPSGCFMLMWRYDDAFMAKSANVSAFKDVASLLATKARRACRRS